MEITNFYNNFHKQNKIQKKVISESNFTYRYLIKILQNFKKIKKVLDYGCGVGTIDFYLASRGVHVTGIDISSVAIDSAKKFSNNLNLKNKPKFLCGDVSNIKIKEQFDLVICSEVLEHVSNDHKIIKNIYKLLKTKGVIIVSVPSSNAPLYRLGLLKKFDLRVGHLRRYNTNSLKKIIELSNLKILDVLKTEGILRNFLFTNNIAGTLIRFIKGPISDIATIFDNICLRLFGESQLILVAIKK